MSQPKPPKDITANTILDAYCKDCLRTVDYAEGGMHLNQEQVLQQLAQGLISKMPEKWKSEVSGGKAEGYNQALSEVEQVIKDYFGVSK